MRRDGATRSAYSDQGGLTTRFLAARMSRIWTRLRRSRLPSTSNRGATRCQCHRRRRRRCRQLQSTNRADEWRSRCQAATRSKELGLLPCCHRRRVRWRQRKRQVRQRSGDRRCQRCQYPALQRCRKAARTPPTVSSQRRAQMPRAWELRSRRSLGRLRQQPTPSKQRKGKGKQITSRARKLEVPLRSLEQKTTKPQQPPPQQRPSLSRPSHPRLLWRRTRRRLLRADRSCDRWRVSDLWVIWAKIPKIETSRSLVSTAGCTTGS